MTMTRMCAGKQYGLQNRFNLDSLTFAALFSVIAAEGKLKWPDGRAKHSIVVREWAKIKHFQTYKMAIVNKLEKLS